MRYCGWHGLMAVGLLGWATVAPAQFFVSPFSADVTVPVGHGMMGGLWKSKSVADRLYAKGMVLEGGERPVVLVSLDWCEIRNDAYDRWRDVLAAAASTTSERVLLSTVHQHDAPVADLGAQRLLEDRGRQGSICDLAFHEEAVQRVAGAVRDAVGQKKRVTHYGIGQARVDRVASNRRYELPDGTRAYNRGSASGRNVMAREAPEGTIDPWLKTLSFWDEGQPVAALSAYATHPMSYYGAGEVSADFPGIARARRQEDTPDCLQIYFSGASGNVTAGKYNDGARTNRATLASRLYEAMVGAWKTTTRHPLDQVEFRAAKVQLQPRDHEAFRVEALERRLMGTNHWEQCLAALGLSWRFRAEGGHRIDVPVIDLGRAQFLLLPGEIYVEYQLAAQAIRPDSFVVVAGYGESATGYIPTEKNWEERDGNLEDWCWVHPGSEAAMLEAIRHVLEPGAGTAPAP